LCHRDQQFHNLVTYIVSINVDKSFLKSIPLRVLASTDHSITAFVYVRARLTLLSYRIVSNCSSTYDIPILYRVWSICVAAKITRWRRCDGQTSARDMSSVSHWNACFSVAYVDITSSHTLCCCSNSVGLL